MLLEKIKHPSLLVEDIQHCVGSPCTAVAIIVVVCNTRCMDIGVTQREALSPRQASSLCVCVCMCVYKKGVNWRTVKRMVVW